VEGDVIERHHRIGASGRRIASLLGAVAAVCALLAAALVGTSSAAVLNVTGTWDSVYSCTAGCAGGEYPDQIKLTQAAGSATVTGTDQSAATLTGSLSGSTPTLKLTTGSYTANFTVTISASRDVWSGPLTDSNGTSGTDTATLQAPPVLAQTGQVAAVSGTVLIEAPGQKGFTPLSSSTTIPVGSTIDATNGTVAVTVAKPRGGTQGGDFYDGEFTLTQAHSGGTTERLAGSSFAVCTGSGATGASGTTRLAGVASASSKGKTVVRKLWGNAHGKFTTSGRAGAATVLGTIWLTEDRCDGTFFKAAKDSIAVVDFAHPNQKHHVTQGQSYLAPLHG
jgi:hypothetical protein